MKNSINFVATKNIVKANGYVIRALYKENAALVEELGGEVVQGNEVFTAKFPTATKAKAFVSQAVTSISKKEYNASRKTAPKKQPAPKGKGNSKAKTITLTDDDGNAYVIPMSAIAKKKTATTKKVAVAPKKTVKQAPKKGKGSSTQMSKSHQAYLETNKAFKNRKVSYGKWKAKYDEILAKL